MLQLPKTSSSKTSSERGKREAIAILQTSVDLMHHVVRLAVGSE